MGRGGARCLARSCAELLASPPPAPRRTRCGDRGAVGVGVQRCGWRCAVQICWVGRREGRPCFAGPSSRSGSSGAHGRGAWLWRWSRRLTDAMVPSFVQVAFAPRRPSGLPASWWRSTTLASPLTFRSTSASARRLLSSPLSASATRLPDTSPCVACLTARARAGVPHRHSECEWLTC